MGIARFRTVPLDEFRQATRISVKLEISGIGIARISVFFEDGQGTTIAQESDIALEDGDIFTLMGDDGPEEEIAEILREIESRQRSGASEEDE